MPTSLLTIDADLSPVTRAFDALTAAVQSHVNDACMTTAQAIVREAQGRLARQLGPAATGAAVAGISAKPAFDGNGAVILADMPDANQPANVPLFLEKGTHPGKRHNYARVAARPFFYASIELEANSHEARIESAMNDAANESGLGS